MNKPQIPQDTQSHIQEVLGYLNFSSGAEDLRFLANLNEIFHTEASADQEEGPAAWRAVCQMLRTRLAELGKTSDTFRDISQAAAVLDLVEKHVLTQYQQFHCDLLVRFDDAVCCNSFFLGKMFEAILRAGEPWEETERIGAAAISSLNDYVGYRPVAVLESRPQAEPYAHERFRPVPLYLREIGAAVGPYEELIRGALAVLEQTDGSLLARAAFDPVRMDEFAVDVRHYDFDHPVNKRPNYHFGQWDPHQINSRGFYHRYVVQKVTLDALQSRIDRPSDPSIPREQLVSEAAAALVGTILMASAVSGSGPDTHTSDVTLALLMPEIATLRDEFYDSQLAQTPEPHRARLVAEAQERRQAFGGVRQELNAELNRRRAAQLENTHVAKLYARLGMATACAGQIQIEPVSSARIFCEIQGRLTQGRIALDRREIDTTARLLTESVDLLQRGIDCGALVDPWNILGFGGQFSLFPALQNSVQDHRIDALVDLMNEIFALYAQCVSHAAAAKLEAVQTQVLGEFDELANWWDSFATAATSAADALYAQPLYEATDMVVGALVAWQEKGEAASDLAFWKQYADDFDSPRAYVLVLETLLDRGDYVAAMALLMHWLGEALHVLLEEGSDSYHAMALRWMRDLVTTVRNDATRRQELLALVAKFFDFLEANAEEYWEAPRLELDRLLGPADPLEDEPLDEEDQELDEDRERYGAAYEDVTFLDSTDDGIEGSLIESIDPTTDYELEEESQRISDRLSFLVTLARLWCTAAHLPATEGNDSSPYGDRVSTWLARALHNRNELMRLVESVQRHRIPQPSGSQESHVEYDRRRVIKDALLEKIIASAVASTEAALMLAASTDAAANPPEKLENEQWTPWHGLAAKLLRAGLAGDRDQVKQQLPDLLAALDNEPILYVPLSRNGQAYRIVPVRALQRFLRLLVRLLPRLGLIEETYQVLVKASVLERENTVGAGAVTEFDELFLAAQRAVVRSVIESASSWSGSDAEELDAALVDPLQQLAEIMLQQWLGHSANLRLSVLERIANDRHWQRLIEFIERYGSGFFTQRLFNFGNLRAILHRGVDQWLDDLQNAPDEYADSRLVDDLAGNLKREDAVRHLELVMEAIVENYVEYRDYNSTTTQSDRGELLFMFLDMLRLRVQYDRVAWNLKPVLVVHEVLVRHRRMEAARIWRQAVVERTSEIADQYQHKLQSLQKDYAMRLPTVADRMAERFVRSMEIDRAKSLILPAIRMVRADPNDQEAEPLTHLVEEVGHLADRPTGVGYDLPPWLEALDAEIVRAEWLLEAPAREDAFDPHLDVQLDQFPLAPEELQRQIDAIDDLDG